MSTKNAPPPESPPAASLSELKIDVLDVDPNELLLLERNARYMTADQFARLKKNVQRDGTLTSVPLVYRLKAGENPKFYRPELEGRLIVLSGNHRTDAAVKAGVKSIKVMELLSRVGDEKLIALQLSHNSIDGQDDPSLLQALYEELPLDEKAYSGLTDDTFQVEKLDIMGLSIGSPSYQEVSLMFLGPDADSFDAAVERLGSSPKAALYLGDYRDFDKIFEAIVATKEHMRTYNTAIAFRVMAELALEYIELRQAQAEGVEEPADSEAAE